MDRWDEEGALHAVVSLLTTLANAASRYERAVFLPIALGMSVTSLIVLLT